MADNPISETETPDAPIFSARLTPYRSLGRTGFTIVMLAVGGLSFFGGIGLFLAGAWPVAGFLGLDVALVFLAFRINFASAKAYEEVTVSAYEIRVTRVDARGNRQEFRLNPAWARLEVTRLADEGVTALRLVGHGRSLTIGAFLNPEDRGSFADALRAALSSARFGIAS